MSRFVKRMLSNTFRTLLGRRNTARLGRFLYREACLAPGAYPESLGDQLVQRGVCRYAHTRGQPFVVIDVGANVGEWSRSFSQALSASSIAHRIHAIEPFPATFTTLTQNLRTWKLDGVIRPFHGALSSQRGEHAFFSLGANIGQNSLHPIPGSDVSVTQTNVTCHTLDDLIASWGDGEIGFLKIDTEGHDLEVLRGATTALASDRISLLQFEYNHRWIGSRHYLKDAFDMLVPYGFRIGKITRLGIEFYASWHAELESFIEGNYLAAKGDAASSFAEVAWWNR